MKTRILVVDDEKTITDLVGIYLRNEGYEVQLAYNGADAAQAILTQEFDLAILDIMLPDIDGFELLRTIRTDYTYPVIMLTARDSQSDKIEGLSLGADDYVVKPFRPLELVARVKAASPIYELWKPRPGGGTAAHLYQRAGDQPGCAVCYGGREARAMHADRVFDSAVSGGESWPRRAG